MHICKKAKYKFISRDGRYKGSRSSRSFIKRKKKGKIDITALYFSKIYNYMLPQLAHPLIIVNRLTQNNSCLPKRQIFNSNFRQTKYEELKSCK
uniref:Uncharacterized protein n=1 Tax=Kalanchoe fedtschenkoi TaxID=63787 RepID=A0A7N0VIK4_KALFE